VVEAVTVNGNKKFKKFIYVLLGGEAVRDYYKGIHLEPGVVSQSSVSSWSLTAEQRAFLSEVASVPYTFWAGCTKELLMLGYSLKTDWNKTKDKNGRRLSEDPICKKKRFEINADKIVDLVKRFLRFYLSMPYVYRYRQYYDAAILDVLRAHGQEW